MHQWKERLAELLPPLSDHEALVEANRCVFCYDAPCTHACPTHIDIPRFIKKIASENTLGSATTILQSNLLGATCARVCPVQELCEGACVLGSEHKPIMIGRLQRYAMDYIYGRGIGVFELAPPTSKKIVVIGAGPAGLSCAGELAKRGHYVTLFEKRDLAGGLSTYGIIGLREPVAVSLAEIQMIRHLGVDIRTGFEICSHVKLSELLATFDSVFVSTGLGGTPALGIPGEEQVIDGLQYIEQSKTDPSSIKAGRRVIVVGAGNTAIDCATIAKRIGAETVTIVYRRSESEVSAYDHEIDFIRQEGVEFQFLAQPAEVVIRHGQVLGLACVRMRLGELDSTGRPRPIPVQEPVLFIPADQIIKAIGQEKHPLAKALGLATRRGYIEVNDDFETSMPRVYAGGDCIRASGTCSTVMAVQDGKLAASSIHRRLTGDAV